MDNSQGRYDSLNLSSKTILITGAAGFIGSNLVEYFATHHPKCRILALDCFGDSSGVDSGLALGHFENLTLYPNVEVFPLDITSMQDLKSLYRHGRIDYIFHEAAISDTTCKDSRRVMEVNLLVFKNLVKLAMKYHSHIIYASSAATYGNSEIPHKIGVESADSIYAYSKLCMDRENRILQQSLQDLGLGLIGLRYFNVYGRREFYKGRTASMILQLALQAQSGVVKLFESGEQERDFVYINDVVMANVKALELIWLMYGSIDMERKNLQWHKVHKTFLDSNLPITQEYTLALKQIFGDDYKEKLDSIKLSWKERGAVYNVGYGESASYNRIVELLKKHLKINFEVKYIKNPYTFFQNHTLADREDFLPNYNPSYNIEEGIKDYIPHIESILKDIKEGRKSWKL